MPNGIARKVFEIEAAAILELRERLEPGFERAVGLLFGCAGRAASTR